MSQSLQERLSPHDKDYVADATFVYTEEELQWWVHLFTKRAQYRSTEEKRTKDLYDADNYRAILRAQYPNAIIP